MKFTRPHGSDVSLLVPDWELPAGVTALMSTRQGGVSESGYASLNLGTHVGDQPGHVRSNRDRLRKVLPADVTVQWLKQVHGTRVAQPRQFHRSHTSHGSTRARLGVPTADACYVAEPGIAAAVLTADCLPVLFASRDGQQVAAAHAGWRGLLNGVLEATVRHFCSSPADLTCWLGAAIGPCHFEVGAEVLEAFLDAEKSAGRNPAAVKAAFRPSQTSPSDKYLMDIYEVARIRLQNAGVNQVSGGAMCTVCDAAQWFSFRRDGAVSGRMATLIFRD